MTRKADEGGFDVKMEELELRALLEEAEHLLRADPKAEQVIVVKTAKGDLQHCANHDILSGDTAEEVRFAEELRRRDDGEIRCLAALWSNGCADVPSMHLRERLLELSEKNAEAVLPLRGEDGWSVKTIRDTMP